LASAQNELEHAQRVRGTRLSVLGEHAKCSEKTAEMFFKNLKNSKNICFIFMKFTGKLAVLVECTIPKFELYSYNNF